jgi:hypothetical protein
MQELVRATPRLATPVRLHTSVPHTRAVCFLLGIALTGETRNPYGISVRNRDSEDRKNIFNNNVKGFKTICLHFECCSNSFYKRHQVRELGFVAIIR